MRTPAWSRPVSFYSSAGSMRAQCSLFALGGGAAVPLVEAPINILLTHCTMLTTGVSPIHLLHFYKPIAHCGGGDDVYLYASSPTSTDFIMLWCITYLFAAINEIETTNKFNICHAAGGDLNPCTSGLPAGVSLRVLDCAHKAT
jgi:hypothetical protein